MAGNLLMSISRDERERAVFRSRRMFQTDRESDMATSWDNGERSKALEIAGKMLKRNRPTHEIIEDTGLTHEDLESLQV